MAREGGTHRLARSRSCDLTLRTRGSCSSCVRGGESPMRKSRAEGPLTVSMCSVSWEDPAHPLYTRLCLLQTKYSLHTSSFSRPCFTHQHSREQGLLFEGRFGDPLLASRIFCAVMLEYGQSTNTHKHRHMLLCVFRIIACSE